MPAPTRDEAIALDAADPLRHCREWFHIPPAPGDASRPAIYFAGNSLGLQPQRVREEVLRELDDWAALGVEGHFKQRHGWYAYHETCRGPLARLVGALPHEVVAMNSLTVNLHLMMASFYRPAGRRRAVLIDTPCFPSDLYAVKSQLRFHGVPEKDGLIMLRPRPGEHTLHADEVLTTIERDGDRIALVLFSLVNFATGQVMDAERITAAARAGGCVVGWDLAHAIGNVPMRLHEWGADFAVWCSYKYLSAGPGAVGGCFVHERHARLPDDAARRVMPRFEGWWGNDPATRFEMGEDFVPVPSADAWQLSNPPILSMAPLRVSLELFDQAGLAALRAKSVRLTAFLERAIAAAAESTSGRLRVITPGEPEHRGCQLSIEVAGDAEGMLKRLHNAGVICDLRRPNIIRAAPTPMYNTFEECWRFGQALAHA